MAMEFLNYEMGLAINRSSKDAPVNLDAAELSTYRKRFEVIDKDKKGYVSINDIRRAMKVKDEAYNFK